MGSFPVKAVLDTHAAVWATAGDPRLGKSAKAYLEALKTGEAAIADMCLLEISMLVKKKRILLKVPLKQYLRSMASSFVVLPITAEIAATAMNLDLPQGDPFDRVIAATAIHTELPLITRDGHLQNFQELITLWD
jgi:PIN domain nuclease of toxin-antitoxin system